MDLIDYHLLFQEHAISNWNFGRDCMFFPRDNRIEVATRHSDLSLSEITKVLVQNEVEPTLHNIDLFSALHEIGHAKHLEILGLEKFMSLKFHQDGTNEEYRANVLEKYADTFALIHLLLKK